MASDRTDHQPDCSFRVTVVEGDVIERPEPIQKSLAWYKGWGSKCPVCGALADAD